MRSPIPRTVSSTHVSSTSSFRHCDRSHPAPHPGIGALHHRHRDPRPTRPRSRRRLQPGSAVARPTSPKLPTAAWINDPSREANIQSKYTRSRLNPVDGFRRDRTAARIWSRTSNDRVALHAQRYGREVTFSNVHSGALRCCKRVCGIGQDRSREPWARTSPVPHCENMRRSTVTGVDVPP